MAASFSPGICEHDSPPLQSPAAPCVSTEEDRPGQVPAGTATVVGPERDCVLYEFNATRADYPRNKLVHELFEEQVARCPNAIAIVHGARSLTYAELNRSANRLARYLVAHGVGVDQPVGICIERSPEMIQGLLGIFKAGAAYLPLDPNYPRERLEYMMQDACPKVVLTQEKLRAVLPDCSGTGIALDAKLSEIAEYTADDLPTAQLGLTSQNIAYVIYTSGSTGCPKGTAMPHQAMVNLIEWHRRTFGAGAGDRVLQFAALSFDVAFQETFSTLCRGDTLVLLDEWMRRDVGALAGLLIRQDIARLFVPPLMLQSLAEYFSTIDEVPRALRDVITAGEQLRIGRETTEFFKRLRGSRLHNHYGPTETHVVTSLTLTGDPDTWPALPPIGRPIANSQLYVLDAQRAPLPIGAIGEIYIGGAGVAHGYWKRPELTAQRFIADPFGADPQGRLYRTGDLGRWRADGVLEYLGRNDDQVKIRGYRIELGEIEVHLARHERVREAAVVAREDAPGQQRLVAYVTPRNETGPSIDDLRAHVQAALPQHMVPSAFVILERFPLTPSGKLDRRALPPPSFATTQGDHEGPQGDVEEKLAGIWRQLLRIECVGRRDNFFELGGDSFLMVQMLERLRRLGLRADARLVFENPTLAGLARTLRSASGDQSGAPPNLIPLGCDTLTPSMLTLITLNQQEIDHIAASVPGGAVNIRDIYPLAPLQEGILFHHLLDEGAGDTYVVSALLAVSSKQKLAKLIAALQDVIDRHDALRTLLLWDRLSQPVQVVCRSAPLQVETRNLDGKADPIAQISSWMRPERQRMDLHRGPLVQLKVAERSPGGEWYALLQLHHLICDHESLEALFDELALCTDGCAAGLPPALPYRDHVSQTLAHARRRDAESFFRSKLAGIDESTAPFGLVDVRGDATRIHQAEQELDADVAKAARVQARRLGVSSATLFHAAWALVVARTSRRDDVVFGTLLLGRLQGSAGAQRILGMFMNTLPLRLSLQDVTARELVELTHRELAALLDHEQASLALAQRCSGVRGSAPLFTSLLNYRHSAPGATRGERVIADGVRLVQLVEWTNYPITLSVDDLADGFVLTSKTALGIAPERLLGYVQAALQSLLAALEHASPAPVLQLSILPPDERREVIELFNATRALYPEGTLIHEIFAQQTRRAPDVPAGVCGGQVLTYAELDRRANQLARYLQRRGVGPDRLVGICVERSVEMLVGLLGILKAGGAYVPLDPGYPSERLAYMLADAQPLIVLTQARLKSRLPSTVAEIVALDEDWSDVAAQPPNDAQPHAAGLRSHHLAYVIYTSGSTGRPKAVMVEHRQVVCLWQSLQHIYRQSPACQTVAMNASFTFDSSVKQFVQLLSGRTLVLVQEDDRWDAARLLDAVDRYQIQAIDCTPSQLKSWIAAGLLSRPDLPLRVVLVGGEPIDAQLWAELARSRIDFYNVYGPTECTVDATFAPLRGDLTEPHIGRPMENKRVYLLDEQGQPVPIGVPGEICIGGAGVARGYLDQPQLTAQRFVADPFGTEPLARRYKTGDLGRWRANGTIEYLGRNDDQVKVRGFRIELGEIEAQLMQHPLVKGAVVAVREETPGDKCLVAYVTCKGQEQPGSETLRAHLKAALPDYMVPSAFVMLGEFPLTPSGKLDRRALPAPGASAYVSQEYEPPQGEIELVLADIWRRLLRVEHIGRHDNFFDLGGHSLLAMQVIVHIRSLLSIKLAMTSLFESPTLKQLAAHIEGLREAWLLDSIAGGAHDMDELLESVAAMPEGDVQRLVQELQRGRDE